MTTLTINDLLLVECGRAANERVDGIITTVCNVIGVASVGYAIGAMANWWNPVGWGSAILLTGSVACAVYSLT